jgi:carbon-monoxide dehydrogenase medium subunit
VKPAPFEYRAPGTVAGVVELLHEQGDSAKILAGGQSLVPMLNMRLARPDMIVDISHVPQLRDVQITADGCRYGAAVVHSAIEDQRVPDLTRGLLPAAAAGIGYRAIRNRGTIGGSLSHAASSAEWPIVMAALDATIICQSIRGSRNVPAREFVLGFLTNALEDDELVTEVDVPALASGVSWGLHKTARKPGEFADSFAVTLVEETEGVVTNVVAWLGAASDVPLNVDTLDGLLRSRPLQEARKSEVLAAVAASLPEPHTKDEEYRTHLHGVTMWRALHVGEAT